jgi:hypothetical protein
MTTSVPLCPTLAMTSPAIPSRVAPRMTHFVSRVAWSRCRSTIEPVRTMFSRSRMLRLSSSRSFVRGVSGDYIAERTNQMAKLGNRHLGHEQVYETTAITVAPRGLTSKLSCARDLRARPR